MGNLIVLSRPSIQVVCGKVVAYSADSITIENDVFFPSIGQTEKRFCVLNTEFHLPERMHIRIGVDIMATIRPTQESLSLFDGAYSKDIILFSVAPYTIRYTGAFDFTPRGREREQHVFCGSVLNVTPMKRNGSILSVCWKQNGESVYKTLYSPANTIDFPDKGVFVTGPLRRTERGDIYTIENVSAM